jgi:hypothetical protein
MTPEQAFEYAKTSYSAYRLMDAQMQSIVSSAALFFGIYSEATTASFKGLEIACGVSGKRIVSVTKTLPGVTQGLGRGDSVDVQYQSCSEYQSSVWNGAMTIAVSGSLESRSAAAGTTLLFDVFAQNLSTPGALFSGSSTMNGFVSASSLVTSDTASRKIRYILNPNFQLSLGDISVVAGDPRSFSRIGDSFSMDSDSQNLIGGGNLIIERTDQPKLTANHDIKLTRPSPANGIASAQTGNFKLVRINPNSLSQPEIQRALLTTTVNNQDVVITVDHTIDGIVDLTVNTSITAIGG